MAAFLIDIVKHDTLRAKARRHSCKAAANYGKIVSFHRIPPTFY
jgi:hypothetical protein